VARLEAAFTRRCAKLSKLRSANVKRARTLFEWESADTLRAWASHPEHIPVKKLGRQKFYSEYHLQVCEVMRESKFTRDTDQDQGA
jgi:heme-degrading monooxygenase HmoA